MNTFVFLLVLGSALFHALWNFAARKVSGNFIVLWISLWIACLFLLPLTIGVFIKLGFSQTVQSNGTPYIIATGLIHAVYFMLLGISYKHGEISMVYPIARGFGVALTAIFAGVLYTEEISFLGGLGIAIISFSILSMGFASSHSPSKAKPLISALCLGATISSYSLVDKIGVVYVHPVIYIWLLFFITSVTMAPFILRRYGSAILPTAKIHLKSSVIIGVGSILTYLMVLIAFTMGPLGYIIAVREFAVVFGALAGLIFLKEKFSVIKVLAIIGITIGMVCIKLV